MPNPARRFVIALLVYAVLCPVTPHKDVLLAALPFIIAAWVILALARRYRDRAPLHERRLDRRPSER